MRVSLWGVLTILAVLGALYYIPGPIEGDWYGGTGGDSLRCMCGSFNFMRLKEGRVYIVRSEHPPPVLAGHYERTGWNRYSMQAMDRPERYVLRPGLLVLRTVEVQNSNDLKAVSFDFLVRVIHSSRTDKIFRNSGPVVER